MSLARSLEHWGRGKQVWRSIPAKAPQHHPAEAGDISGTYLGTVSRARRAHHTWASGESMHVPPLVVLLQWPPVHWLVRACTPPKRSPQSRVRSPVAKTPKPHSTNYFHSIEAQPSRANSHLVSSRRAGSPTTLLPSPSSPRSLPTVPGDEY